MPGNTNSIDSEMTGFFGKIPSHGDFIDRGLSAGFKDKWDDWLQHSLAASKAVIGDDWLNIYLTSPVWRFVLSAGICGPEAWAGVMLPSVDRVGRYFPLTIAKSLPADIVPIQLLIAGADWFDGAEGLGLQALEHETIDANILETKLKELGDMNLGSSAVRAEHYAARLDGALALPFSYGSSPGQGLLAYTHRLTESRFGGAYSTWWTHGSDFVHASMMVCAQLPSSDSFAGLLTDQCAPASWERLPGYSVGDAPPEVEEEVAAPEANTQVADILPDDSLVPPPTLPDEQLDEQSEAATAFEAPEQVSSDSILADLGRSDTTKDPE